jgi:16S rRNA (cytosine1402-N4)-methyltransferase
LSKQGAPHVPIMVGEAIEYFKDRPLKVFFEGTVGAGGHAKAFLEAHPEIELYLACDRDPEALEIAKKTLEPWKDKVRFVQGNFSDLERYLDEAGVKTVDGFFLTWECRQCN